MHKCKKNNLPFRLNCVAELYKDLGKYDAIVEFTETSIRVFIEQSQKHGNFESYLQLKSNHQS